MVAIGTLNYDRGERTIRGVARLTEVTPAQQEAMDHWQKEAYARKLAKLKAEERSRDEPHAAYLAEPVRMIECVETGEAFVDIRRAAKCLRVDADRIRTAITKQLPLSGGHWRRKSIPRFREELKRDRDYGRKDHQNERTR